MRYIYQHKAWPNFQWDSSEIEEILSATSFMLGKFSGRLSTLGFDVQNEAVYETLSAEILNSAKIEGENLNREEVRSSVAKRMEIVGSGVQTRSSYEAESRVDMMMDATRNWALPMTEDRFFSWHAALFPTGYSGVSKINVGRFRDDKDGAMRVVSRRGMMERVHFVAPDAGLLKKEFGKLLSFVNGKNEKVPWLLHSAIAHLWFLTLHPFDDGNGRIARALTEYLLAKGERTSMRFYSLSSQIQKEKDLYYEEIERAQRGTLDVTGWLKWFLLCHQRALETANVQLNAILTKAEFWQHHATDNLTKNQRLILNKLFDGFEGNLTSSKWAKICKVSQDTASREINVLISMGILRQKGQGRSTHYVLV